MRQTRIERDGGEARVLRTDDIGTTLLDGAGSVLAEHGNDRHEMLLAEHQAEGWRVVADEHCAPAGAEPPPPQAGGPAPSWRAGEDG